MKKHIAIVCFTVFLGSLTVQQLQREYLQSSLLLAAKPANPGNNGGRGDHGNANGGGHGGGGNHGNANGGDHGGRGDHGNANGGENGGRGDRGDNGGGNSGNKHKNSATDSGGDGGGSAALPGRGLAQHAAALHNILKQKELHRNAAFEHTFHHQSIRPASFASKKEEEAWLELEHEACCSMFRYLQRLKELHPSISPGYIDWIAGQVAKTFQEDPTEMKAALLGYPHKHPHTSEVLLRISEQGCALVGDTAAIHNEEFAEEHSVHEQEESSPYSIDYTISDTEISFAVMDGATIFTTYGISHTKEMHLLVMRDDLRHFYHIHPERNDAGVWSIPFESVAGGTYWLYADFTDANGKHHTIRFEHVFAGDLGEHGYIFNPVMKKSAGRYTVVFEISPYSGGTLFTFRIADGYGEAPRLEPYLGAMGHGILISPSGGFIHTHPSPVGDHLTFHVGDVPDTMYRVFTQFQVEGQVLSVEFDWKPEKSAGKKSHEHE